MSAGMIIPDRFPTAFAMRPGPLFRTSLIYVIGKRRKLCPGPADRPGARQRFRFLRSMTLQNTTATAVLTAVARIAGPTMAVGEADPYWLR